MHPVEPIGGATAPSQIHGASSRHRCGHDGQRKRVAHMPTATTTKEDSRSKLVQNHPHDSTKKPFSITRCCRKCRRRPRCRRSRPPPSPAPLPTAPPCSRGHTPCPPFSFPPSSISLRC